MEIFSDVLLKIAIGIVLAILSPLIGYYVTQFIRSKTERPDSRKKEKMTLIPRGANYFLVIDLEDDDIKRNVSGKSGGLAFSLKFAQKIFQRATGRELNFSVAATGIVDLPTKKAQVKKVAGINEKFRAALSCLNAGDKLFYPAENEAEIDLSLKESLTKKGIVLHPVATVEQAINLLFEEYLKTTQLIPPRNWFEKFKFGMKAIIAKIKEIYTWKWLIILAIIALIAVPYFLILGRIPSYDQIINSLEYGEFSEVKGKIEYGLNKVKDENLISQFKELSDQLNTDLHLAIQFEYYESEDDSTSLSSQGEIQQLSDLSLSNHDGYRFKVSTNENCYFYLFQFDSNDGVELLYPLSSFSLENHFLLGNRTYSIPGGENYFYIQDDIHQGSVTIYFICSFWRAKDIEEAYYQYEEASPDQKRKFRDRLLLTIQQRAIAIDKGIKGIFYKKEFFLKE